MQPRVVSIGSFIVDLQLTPTKRKSASSGATECQAARHPSGVAFSVAQQTHALGVTTCPVLMTGPRGGDVGLCARVESELGRAVWWPCLEQDPVSVWLSDRCFTARWPASTHAIPAHIRRELNEATCAVVAPLEGRDTGLVAELVRAARHSVLMLSCGQLTSRAASVPLMSASDLTVVSQAGIEQLTGLADPREAIQRICDHGVRNLLVTGQAGVMGLLDGDWHWRPFLATEVKQTLNAEAVFVGTVAAGLTHRLLWKEILELATAAHALYCAGKNPRSLDALREIGRAGFVAGEESPSVGHESCWAHLRDCVPAFLRRPFA